MLIERKQIEGASKMTKQLLPYENDASITLPTA